MPLPMPDYAMQIELGMHPQKTPPMNKREESKKNYKGIQKIANSLMLQNMSHVGLFHRETIKKMTCTLQHENSGSRITMSQTHSIAKASLLD